MRLIDADALLKALNDYGLSYRADINGMIMQAPTIAPSGDLISRADAITEFREWVKRANENGETPTWNDAVSLIGSLPSADITDTGTCIKCQETTERVLNNQGKKIKICAYCKYKGKEQKTDTEGFTYYRWFCELTGENIEATGTCERWEHD